MLSPTGAPYRVIQFTIANLQEARDSNLPAIEVYNNLVNLEFILGLAILMPLLQTLNWLNKTLQERGLLLLDAVRAVHDAHKEIAKNYLQPDTAFQGSPFVDYTDFSEMQCVLIEMKGIGYPSCLPSRKKCHFAHSVWQRDCESTEVGQGTRSL